MTDRINSSLSLHQLLQLVDDAVQVAMPAPYWVRAEILNVHHSGYWRLELTSYEDGKKAKATAMIWQSQRHIVEHFEATSGTKLAKGLKILIRLDVAFDAQYGLRLNVREFDPTFSLGDMEARLNVIRQRLTELGELTRNRHLTKPTDYTRVAVVSPESAAGLGDFRTQADALQKHRLCDFCYFPAYFQGDRNESSLISAFQEILKLNEKQPFDAVVVIRGGGDKAGLYELNKIKIARSICRMPIPVLVGVGHERDVTILDELANRSFATPSLVVSHILSTIIDNVRSATKHFMALQKQSSMLLDTSRLECLGQNERLFRFSFEMLYDSRDKVIRSNRSIRTSPLDQLRSARVSADKLDLSIKRNAENTVLGIRNVLFSQRSLLETRAEQCISKAKEQTLSLKASLFHSSSEAMLKQRYTLQQLYKKSLTITDATITSARHSVEKMEALIQHLNPTKILERGFALVFSTNGDVISSTHHVSKNEDLKIRLRDGTINVTAKTKDHGDE